MHINFKFLVKEDRGSRAI